MQRRQGNSLTGHFHVSTDDPPCHDTPPHRTPRRRGRRHQTRRLLPEPISTSSSRPIRSTPPAPAITASTSCSTTCRRRPAPPTRNASQKTLADLRKHIDKSRCRATARSITKSSNTILTYALWQMDNSAPLRAGPAPTTITSARASFCCLTQSTLPQERNVENAVKRMAFIPKVVAAAKESLKDPPRVFVETAIRQNRGAIAFYESGHLRDGRRDARPQRAAHRQQAGRRRPEGLSGLPRKRSAAAGQGRMAARQGALLPQAGAGIGRRPDGRSGAGRGGEGIRPRRARAVRHRRQMWGQRFPGKPLPPDDAEGRRETIRRVVADVGKEHGKPEDSGQGRQGGGGSG